jgi:ferritin
MIGNKMEEALNGQVNAEMYSAYLYLSMESYFKSLNLNGFANWMRVQTQEEMMHAMKIYDFINERRSRVTLKPIDGPPTKWESPRAVFEAVYAHEQKVTGLINQLVDLAIEEKDHATNTFLQWFVNEQVEEESPADEIVQQLKMMENAPGGMFMLDRELGQRVFTPPATEGE